MKSGFVAIIGKSNVGKSTILNAILERKVAIVTDKVQTTRDVIRGIYNDDDSQIVFLDTPGIHKPLHTLGERMNDSALKTMRSVDVIVVVIDGSKKPNKGDEIIYQKLTKNIPIIFAINKIDLIDILTANERKAEIMSRFPNAHIVETEAKVGFNIDQLIKEIKSFLPEGPKYYASDVITDKSSSYLVGELIREALLNALKEEVPHGMATYVETIAEEKTKVYINAFIYVERESHRPIIIGKGGARLKSIGTHARVAIEEFYNKKVFLELHVLVKENWQNSPSILKKLGY